MKYSYYSGAGNTFFLLDNRKKVFSGEYHRLSQEVCSQFKHPLDGLIVVEPSLRAQVCMRIFNPDGSEAEMCGNGLRSLIKFLQELKEPGPRYSIETKASNDNYEATVYDDEVLVYMTPPHHFRESVDISLSTQTLRGFFINSGVPHTVIFVDDLSSVDIEKVGKHIRYHPLFSPEGTNVNFVSLVNKNTLSIRTYERGVERETLACGTGALASALVAAKVHALPAPLYVKVRSNDTLKINFKLINDPLANYCAENVTMQGPAQRLSTGTFVIKEDFKIQFL